MNKYKPFLFLIVMFGVLAITSCGAQPAEIVEEQQSLVPIEIKVALSSPHVWIQPVVAQYEGFFEQVGLDVELIKFATGKLCMDALVGGEVDIATTAMGPAIFAAFQNQPIAIIAENARFPAEKVTVRVESGITTPEDLRGKKIGVVLGTDIHFFLHLFLQEAGMTEADVEIINLAPADMVIALSRGDIDAFVHWKPQPQLAKEVMGDGVFYFEQPTPPYYESLYLTVTLQELIETNSEGFDRFMQAMVLADEFAARNPDKVKQYVAEFSEVDLVTAEDLMEGYEYKIWLDQTLISGSEQRAQWQMDFDMAPDNASMPNFRNFVFAEPLENVAPDRVSLD